MTLEELIKSLGLDTDENKDKASILKKEFNAKTKEVKDITKELEKSSTQLETFKDVEDKLKIVKEAFNLDLEAEDFDTAVDEAKESLSTATKVDPVDKNELKELKREKTKLTRERDNLDKQYKEVMEQLSTEKTSRINQKKSAEIRKALDTNKVLKPDQMIDLFNSKVIADDNGEVFTIKSADGSELTISDYIADWVKDNPEFVKSDLKGGTGSGPLSNFNVNKDASKTGKDNVDPIMQAVLNNANANAGVGADSMVKLFG